MNLSSDDPQPIFSNGALCFYRAPLVNIVRELEHSALVKGDHLNQCRCNVEF